MKKIFKVLFVVSISCFFISCSKGESSSDNWISKIKSRFSKSESILEKNPLAKKISVDAPVFVIWDSTNSEYRNMLKKYPQAFSSNTFESLAKNDTAIKNYFEILKRIFNTEKLDATSFASKGIFFFEELKDKSFPVAVYIQLERNLDASQVYKAIKDVATENNLSYQDIDIDGNKAASVTFSGKNSMEFTMNFLVKGEGIAISNKVDLVKRYLDSNFNSGYVEKLLNEDEDFKRSYQKSLKDNTTSFGFAALILNSNFLPEKSVQEELSKLPVKNLVMNQAFNNKDMLITRVASYYTPKTDEQKKLANTFNTSNSVVAPATLPVDTIASITISMKLVKDLVSEFNLEKEIASYAYLLDMKNLNVLLQSPRGTMFPNIAIVAEGVKDANKITTEVKNVISNAKGALPIPMNAWQNKKINNLDTEYLMTPFGIGLFMTKNSDGLILSSSESFVSEMTGDAAKKNASNIRAKYNAKNDSIFNMYASSKAFAKTIRALNATLSAFAKTDLSSYNETINLLEQTPDSVIDIFSEDNTVIGESKIVLE